MPAIDPRQATEDGRRLGERRERPDRQGLREEPVAELRGRADRAQGRVQDRHPVAQPLGFLESMGRQEDRDAALAEPVDQLVDTARGDRVQAGGRLVEEEDLRLAEERPRKGDPLAKALGQRAAWIVRAVGEVDGLEGAPDSIARVRHLVQLGEALEVLDDAQAEVEPRRLGHDRDAAPDLHAVLGRQRDPGHRGGAGRRRDERAERPDRRRLAGAIGAEEAEDLATPDVERDIVECETGAERLREVADRQRGVWPFPAGRRRGRLGHHVRTLDPTAFGRDGAGRSSLGRAVLCRCNAPETSPGRR